MPIQTTNAILANNYQEEINQYVLVRTGLFHYLKITDNERDVFNSSDSLESKPNLVFYEDNSETKVMLDYSNASDKDKKYLNILFKGLNQFSGLSFSNSSFLDEKQNTEKTFDLDLQFRHFQNNILIAKTTNSIDSGDLQKVFDGDYFISIPTITTNSSWNDKESIKNSLILLINSKTENSFDNYCFVEGDLVEIINPDSANNNQKFEILEYITANNKQILKLKTKAVNESLIGKSTIFNIYTKTKKELPSATLDQTTPGCCYDILNNKYLEKASEYECAVRTNGYFQHIKTNCADAQVFSIPLPVISVNSKIVEAKKINYVLYDSTLREDLYISFDDSKNMLINKTIVSQLTLSKDRIYRFIQDDSSNIGLPIRIAKTPNTTSREFINYYYDGVFGTTNPEGVGSEIYLKTTDNTLNSLFLLTENDLTIPSVNLLVI